MGIAESGIFRAPSLGERFGIIALCEASVRRQRRMVRQMGRSLRYADSVQVDASAADAADAAIRARLIDAGQVLVRQRGADVVVLGCAGMASHRQVIETAVGPRWSSHRSGRWSPPWARCCWDGTLNRA